MLHAAGKDVPSNGRYFNRTAVGSGLWIISTASELFSVAGSSDLTVLRCFFGQLGGSGVLGMQRDVLDPFLLPSSRQRFPSPHRAAGSDALLKGDGGSSILQPACWPHARRTELPGGWGEADLPLPRRSSEGYRAFHWN